MQEVWEIAATGSFGATQGDHRQQSIRVSALLGGVQGRWEDGPFGIQSQGGDEETGSVGHEPSAAGETGFIRVELEAGEPLCPQVAGTVFETVPDDERAENAFVEVKSVVAEQVVEDTRNGAHAGFSEEGPEDQSSAGTGSGSRSGRRLRAGWPGGDAFGELFPTILVLGFRKTLISETPLTDRSPIRTAL